MSSDSHSDTIHLGSLLTVGDQIQAFGLARKTGEIRITNVPAPARINLVDGEVVDAEYGTLTGVEAAISLINLMDARTQFMVGVTPPRTTIDMAFMRLLFEAVRRKDELAVTTNLRELERISTHHPMFRIVLGDRQYDHLIRPGFSRVGRAMDNDLVILDMSVSKRHATIAFSAHGVLLKDVGSTNGTFVAGHRITEHWLSDQSSVQFGSVRALFIDSTERQPEPPSASA